MGILRTLHELKEASEGHADNEALTRLLMIPSILAVAEDHYQAMSRPMKMMVKARVRQMRDGVSDLSNLLQAPDSSPVVQRIRHLVAVLPQHEHADDAEVRRWARLCRELQNDSKVLDILCSLAMQFESSVQDIICMYLTWTMSECTKRRIPIAPYVGP